jgi:hyperosmotically inducible protein
MSDTTDRDRYGLTLLMADTITGQYVDDASITTKVKAVLLDDSGLKSFDISVTTSKDVVQLSGVVNSDHARARATEVASGVAGVRGVVNNLAVE